MRIKEFFLLFRDAVYEWLEDKAPRLGAALAYYTVFSMAPLLVISIAMAGMVFGKAASEGEVYNAIKDAVGEQGAQLVQQMLVSVAKPKAGLVATVIGLVTLIVGAMAVFVQLKDAMNTIWEVAPKPNPGIMYYVLNYVLSFAMVLGIGFLLLVSLVLSTALTAIGTYFSQLLPGGAWLWGSLNTVISFFVVMLLFAMIFKMLPDAVISWNDVWAGAAVTAFLFTLGKYGLSIYLSRSSVGSAYGAAGSLMVILLWVYYSAQILFFGAEITQVYANRKGEKIVPKKNAIRVNRKG